MSLQRENPPGDRSHPSNRYTRLLADLERMDRVWYRVNINSSGDAIERSIYLNAGRYHSPVEVRREGDAVWVRWNDPT